MPYTINDMEAPIGRESHLHYKINVTFAIPCRLGQVVLSFGPMISSATLAVRAYSLRREPNHGEHELNDGAYFGDLLEVWLHVLITFLKA